MIFVALMITPCRGGYSGFGSKKLNISNSIEWNSPPKNMAFTRSENKFWIPGLIQAFSDIFRQENPKFFRRFRVAEYAARSP